MFKKILLIFILALVFIPISASAKAATLLRVSGDSKVYEIINGQKHWIPTAEIFNSRGYSWGQIQTATPGQISQYPQARLLMDETDKKVYYLNPKNQIKWIVNEAVFSAYGNKWSDVLAVSSQEINAYQKVNLVRAQNDTKVYLLEGTTKRWITSAEAFNANAYNWELIDEVLPAELNAYTTGPNITASGVPQVAGTPTVVLKANGATGQLALNVSPASFTLSWQAQNASSCSGSGSWSGSLAISGSSKFLDQPAGTYTYTITCTGANAQTATDSITVTVSEQATELAVDLKVNDQNENISPIYPANYTLSWTSSLELDTCVASGSWGGDKDTAGSYAFSGQGTGTYTYLITCTDTETGQTASDTITVTIREPTLPTVNFTVNGSYSSISPTAPASFSLDWSAANANYCSASGAWVGSKDVSGSQSFSDVSAGYRTYTLTCYNNEGSKTASVVVDVN